MGLGDGSEWADSPPRVTNGRVYKRPRQKDDPRPPISETTPPGAEAHQTYGRPLPIEPAKEAISHHAMGLPTPTSHLDDTRGIHRRIGTFESTMQNQHATTWRNGGNIPRPCRGAQYFYKSIGKWPIGPNFPKTRSRKSNWGATYTGGNIHFLRKSRIRRPRATEYDAKNARNRHNSKLNNRAMLSWGDMTRLRKNGTVDC